MTLPIDTTQDANNYRDRYIDRSVQYILFQWVTAQTKVSCSICSIVTFFICSKVIIEQETFAMVTHYYGIAVANWSLPVPSTQYTGRAVS